MNGIVSGSYQRTTGVGRQLYSQSITGTGVAVPLSGDDVETLSIIIQTPAANAGVVRVGNAERQDYLMPAGDAVTIPIDRLHIVYVFVPAGDVVNFLASLPAGG